MTKPNKIKQDIKKLQKNKQFLIILMLLFVALLFWMTISLITSQTTEKISLELTTLAKPLTPSIDITVLDKIEQKRSYSSEELSAFTIFKVLISRDGKTEKIVPIEVSIDDLEPESKSKITSTKSLLNDEVNNDLFESSTSATLLEESPSSLPSLEVPSSNLGSQL